MVYFVFRMLGMCMWCLMNLVMWLIMRVEMKYSSVMGRKIWMKFDCLDVCCVNWVSLGMLIVNVMVEFFMMFMFLLVSGGMMM